MASLFGIGNVRGWVFSYPTDGSYGPVFRADSSGNGEFFQGSGSTVASATTPDLQGSISGLSIEITLDIVDSGSSLSIKQIDSLGAVVSDSGPIIASGSSSYVVLEGTKKVRLESTGSVSITALDIPGLVSQQKSTSFPNGGMPTGWGEDSSSSTGWVSYDPSVSAPGNPGGSIKIASQGGACTIDLGPIPPGYKRQSMVHFSARMSSAEYGEAFVNAALKGEYPGEAFELTANPINGLRIARDVAADWVTFAVPITVDNLSKYTLFFSGPPFDFYFSDIEVPGYDDLLEEVAPEMGNNRADLAPPMASMSAKFGGSALLSPPSPSVRLFLGAVVRASPGMGKLYSAGHDSTGENAAALTAPRPTLTATGGANAKLTAPRPVMGITGTFTNAARAALTAPSPALDASGTVSETGSFSPYIGSPMATLIGYGGAVSAVSAPMPRLQISGTLGGIASVAMVCPLFELTAGGHAENRGSAHLIAPMPGLGATIQTYMMAPMAKLMAIGSAVVEVTYEAYAINLNHAPGNQEPVDEVTHYTNFPFNGIVRYQSSYYGWGADGLYLLEGAMDDANEIPYAVRTCIDDFKLTNKKNVVSAYFAGRIGPDMTVTLYAGEDGQASYDYHTANGPQARTHREKFARGVIDRYFAIGVSGKGALELADIELEINK